MSKSLATDVTAGGRKAAGFCTPKEDPTPQRMCVPPRRVLPIVFLPGIMGSNLRMSPERQAELARTNNIAWRPDNVESSLALRAAKPATRQNQLDPFETEVDTYDPDRNPTGEPGVTSDKRHYLGPVHTFFDFEVDSPLLTDDPPAMRGGKTKEQKARARGWGEIYFGSYRRILEMCEQMLNTPFDKHGSLAFMWREIIGVAPSKWQVHTDPELKPILEEEFAQAVKGTWFPVHAMGYNWLRSNRESAQVIAKRITSLINWYRSKGFQCEKVIIVTHSMGGLVARALVHPNIGGLEADVLGVVHGVMPATGAPAAYKRMRCGFDGSGVAVDILGKSGPEVTAVLANSQGGLELLPSKAYGNGWLQIKEKEKVLAALPKNGDPYDEIYKVTDKWYGLLRPHWINPAKQKLSSMKRTFDYLERARKFHDDINETYHGLSYAHYGADPDRPSWETVTWDLGSNFSNSNWDSLQVVQDNHRGGLSAVVPQAKASASSRQISINLGGPIGAGDETVPLRSAEHQLRSRRFSGIFRQTGYEHQGSYSNVAALHCTIYSLVRIIQTMKWSKK